MSGAKSTVFFINESNNVINSAWDKRIETSVSEKVLDRNSPRYLFYRLCAIYTRHIAAINISNYFAELDGGLNNPDLTVLGNIFWKVFCETKLLA